MRHFSKLLFSVLALAAIPAFVSPASAYQGHAGMAGHDMAQMAQTLNLTEDQQARIKAIFADMQVRMKQVLTPAQMKKMGALHEHATPQNMNAAQFAKAIHATSEQMAQLKSIRDSFMAQVKPVKEDSSLSAEEKSAKMKSLQEAAHAQVRKVLTPAQMKKFDEIHERGGQEHAGMGMAQMAKALNLTSDQKARLKALHEEAHSQIREILNPDQQTKFDAMHEHGENGSK